ncbi:hypothetical protein BDZ91DRAFT_802562 [Kalaharituber pfeilii]|nr:hypothetical protein BDZ91DRAFT_802562 [Kalaharituber pfeilii]
MDYLFSPCKVGMSYLRYWIRVSQRRTARRHHARCALETEKTQMEATKEECVEAVTDAELGLQRTVPSCGSWTITSSSTSTASPTVRAVTAAAFATTTSGHAFATSTSSAKGSWHWTLILTGQRTCCQGWMEVFRVWDVYEAGGCGKVGREAVEDHSIRAGKAEEVGCIDPRITHENRGLHM